MNLYCKCGARSYEQHLIRAEKQPHAYKVFTGWRLRWPGETRKLVE